MQAQRWQLIQKLINAGVFTKVDVPGKLPRVYVTPRFNALDFDTKQKFVSVVALLLRQQGLAPHRACRGLSHEQRDRRLFHRRRWIENILITSFSHARVPGIIRSLTGSVGARS
jgi:hypothetical protein